MEEMEHRVWQRVMAERDPEKNSGLKALAMDSMEAAQRYKKMAAGSSGKGRELAGNLWEAERKILHVLKGLYFLQEGERLRCPPLPQPECSGEKGKIRCYYSARRTYTEYLSRAAEPDWGVVFQSLAEMQKRQCVQLAQLMGME